MTTRQRLAFAVGILLLALTASAADKRTDFTGVWVLHKLEAPDQRGPDLAADTLMISQTEAELRVVLQWTRSAQEHPPVAQSFNLDGKENRNPTDNGRGELRSRTEWAKSRLVIKGTEQISAGEFTQVISFERSFSLSKDGKVLTMSTSRAASYGSWCQKRTFKKS
jgi:hypothetical protein